MLVVASAQTGRQAAVHRALGAVAHPHPPLLRLASRYASSALAAGCAVAAATERSRREAARAEALATASAAAAAAEALEQQRRLAALSAAEQAAVVERAHRRLLAHVKRSLMRLGRRGRHAWRLVRRVATLLALAGPLALLYPLAVLAAGGPAADGTKSPVNVAGEMAGKASKGPGAAEVAAGLATASFDDRSSWAERLLWR